MKSLSEQIADFIVGTKFQDLPAAVVRKAKEQIIFFFGRAFEGSTTDAGRQMRTVLHPMEQSQGGATVIAERFRLLVSDAAFANCSLMRESQGRDDVIWPAGIHAGSITLPTALAVGEVKRVSGREMLLALILGYEVMGKLGRAADSWATKLPRRPTNVYGGYGPITVAGRLLNLDQQCMSNALGYAANLEMGIPEGGMMDHYYSLINRNGILAAQLAEAGGAPYSRYTIEGTGGLFHSFFGEVPATLPALIGSLGHDWEILTAEQKHFPGTGQNTVPIELLIELVKAEKLNAAQVVKIEVVQPDFHEAIERKGEVSSLGPFTKLVQAYSSLPYALALVLLEGTVAMRRYADSADVNDPSVAREMHKINITDEEGHGPRYCRLAVYTKDGRKLVREAKNFAYRFPPAVWGAWLQEAGTRLLPIAQLRTLEHLVVGLEDLDDVSTLMAVLVPPEPR